MFTLLGCKIGICVTGNTEPKICTYADSNVIISGLNKPFFEKIVVNVWKLALGKFGAP